MVKAATRAILLRESLPGPDGFVVPPNTQQPITAVGLLDMDIIKAEQQAVTGPPRSTPQRPRSRVDRVGHKVDIPDPRGP